MAWRAAHGEALSRGWNRDMVFSGELEFGFRNFVLLMKKAKLEKIINDWVALSNGFPAAIYGGERAAGSKLPDLEVLIGYRK
jgi:hypothetical protein